MPEIIRGTLTSSGSHFVHTSRFTILLHKPCSIAISRYSGPPYLENYARVVAFKPGLQRASFYSVTDFLPHSITAKLLLLYTYRRVLSEP